MTPSEPGDGVLGRLRTLPVWGWVLVLLIVVAAAGASWRMTRPAPTPAMQVQAAPLVRTLQFSARVASLSRVDVGSTITARVARVLVRPGDSVRAGQSLIELETDELRAAVAQAQASHAQATATLRAARLELKRAQALVSQGFVSASRLDDAHRGVDVADGQREAAFGAFQAAQARLAQTRILAPAGARVLMRHAEPGQIVQAGRALLSLSLQGPTQLVAQVDERFLEQLQVGQAAYGVADAFPGQRFAAQVISLAPVIDPQRGSIEVKLATGGTPPPFLREDMTLSVEVITGQRDQSLVIPLSALRSPESVLVVQEERAHLRAIRTGLRTLEGIEVVEGLNAGDIVLLGAALEPGQRIEPVLRAWRPGQGVAGVSREDAVREMGRALTDSMGR